MNPDRIALQQVRDDLRRMEQVRKAPRCTHVKSNGVRCGSPALLNRSFCYAHTQMHRPSPGLDCLPPFEDANGIQCALMQVADAIVRDAIDTRRAAVLLYALQIASANLKRVSFEPSPHQIVLDELQDAAVGSRIARSKKNPRSSVAIRAEEHSSALSAISAVKGFC